MYMYANEIAFRILQRVYAACVWEYQKKKEKKTGGYTFTSIAL
jgi:hypothetical protein